MYKEGKKRPIEFGWKEVIVSTHVDADKQFVENTIANSILNVLSTARLTNRSREDTIKIKKILIQLGLDSRYCCYSRVCNDYELHINSKGCYFTNHEWLYDLIWFTEPAPYQISTVPLALECEWEMKRDAYINDIESSAIKYDFGKLLLNTAFVNVMIFRCPRKGIEELDQYFQDSINAYKGESPNPQIFLCIAYKNAKRKFLYKVFDKQINK